MQECTNRFLTKRAENKYLLNCVPQIFLYSWACTRYWTGVHREVNSSYACPLPAHSIELSRRHIPVRLYQIFDRIGATVPGYRAGVRWCNSCSKPEDEKLKSERDYSPPEKVFHPVFLCHNKETHVHPLKNTCI